MPADSAESNSSGKKEMEKKILLKIIEILAKEQFLNAEEQLQCMKKIREE